MTLETDVQLIHKTLTQDRAAMARLVERHRPAVTKTAYRALGNADDAQDVAQEALVYALQRLSDLREPDRFTAWLRHVTLSLCVDYRRRRGTRRLGEPLAVLNEKAEEARYAERLTIRQAVSHLSEAHRMTLLLHYAGGWSLEEVATLLAIPINTVRSRLMAAKRNLRVDLDVFDPEIRDPEDRKRKTKPPMSDDTLTLSEIQSSLLYGAFPNARILSIQRDPEPWMPFNPRVRLALPGGEEKTVDFRGDIASDQARLLPTLQKLGIPGPQMIAGPVPEERGGHLSLCEMPRGENLLLWALGGTPHRLRLATERAFESIERLQALTDSLLADPVGATLARRTLADEVASLTSDAQWRADPWLNRPESAVAEWRNDPWFATALSKVQTAVADIDAPLVYTHYLHYFPNGVRIYPGSGPFDEPLGWPGDARYQANPLSEYVNPFGHFGDPLLDLAMVWIYDCYPFVHTGFVEQFLWRKSITRRDFAPRLALRALQTIARELPIARPADGASYWDSLHAYVEQGLAWL
jgi:RNA polymerase sigma-70 factor (ECF subfamily)